MSRAWLGLGSNLGDKRAHIRQALELLTEQGSLVAVSSLYKTEPVGFKEQDWFLNCAAEFETELPPRQLLEVLKAIEQQLGRERRIRNGPRTIDLDILLYEDLVIREEGLEVPHPRMHERRFVLTPLSEIAQDLAHPTLGKRIQELADKVRQPEQVELWEKRSETPRPQTRDQI